MCTHWRIKSKIVNIEFINSFTGCEYGDKRDDCSQVSLDECENDNTVRDECCQTCHYLKENGMFS